MKVESHNQIDVFFGVVLIMLTIPQVVLVSAAAACVHVHRHPHVADTTTQRSLLFALLSVPGTPRKVLVVRLSHTTTGPALCPPFAVVCV